MSERSSGENQPREISIFEQRQFLDAVQSFGPLLRLPQDYEPGSWDTKEANFVLDDGIVRVERSAVLDDAGEPTERFYWEVSLFETVQESLKESPVHPVMHQRSFTVAENEHDLPPMYEEKFLSVDPETGIQRVLRSEREEELLRDISNAESDEDKARVVVKGGGAISKAKKELQELTGIEGNDRFTEECLREVLTALSEIQPDRDLR